MKSMTAYKTQSKGKVIAAVDGILILEPETGPATEPIAMAQVKTLGSPKPPEKWKFTARVTPGAEAGGVGYQVWESETKNLSLKIGPSYVSEDYSEPQPNFDNKDHRDYAKGFWAIDVDMWPDFLN
jgi:hypothetical protein